LKDNAGVPCTANGFNSCYNELARSRHNDYREGHEFPGANAQSTVKLTPLLIADDVRAKDLQKQMDKTTFTGAAASITVPKECSMNMYTASGTAKDIKELETNHVATDAWYQTGEANYDYTKNTEKAGLTAPQKSALADFTRMVWSSTTKVAFGIKGKYVVAWYCEVKGNAFGIKASKTEPAATYEKNVGKSCLTFSPNSPKTWFNKCYNARQIKAHNDKRSLHESPKLSANDEASHEIQSTLNEMTRGEKVVMPQSSMRSTKFRDCGENVYTGTDAVKLFNSALATNDWYDGMSEYDFATYKPKNQYAPDASD
jgi:hypothetical protein